MSGSNLLQVGMRSIQRAGDVWGCNIVLWVEIMGVHCKVVPQNSQWSWLKNLCWLGQIGGEIAIVHGGCTPRAAGHHNQLQLCRFDNLPLRSTAKWWWLENIGNIWKYKSGIFAGTFFGWLHPQLTNNQFKTGSLRPESDPSGRCHLRGEHDSIGIPFSKPQPTLCFSWATGMCCTEIVYQIWFQ